mgnify:CR=1 FL=1
MDGEKSADGKSAQEVLIAEAKRWQSLQPLDRGDVCDVLYVLGDGAFDGSSWSEGALDAVATDGGETMDFASFASLMGELAVRMSELIPSNPAGGRSMLLRMRIDEAGVLLLLNAPAWAGPAAGIVDRIGASTSRALTLMEVQVDRLRQGLEEAVREASEPLLDLKDQLDPLGPLDRRVRTLIPSWHHPIVGQMVQALRRGRFPLADIRVLVSTLYLLNEVGVDGREQARRSWTVLRAHAHRFGMPNDRPLKTAAGGSGGGGELLLVEPCKRMISLLATPLVKPLQLDAIFSGFDTDKDGVVSEHELELLFRLLNPHRRLAKHSPVQMPEEQTALGTLLKTASETVHEVAAPRLAAAREFVHQLATDPMSFFEDDDDD